MAAQVAFNKVFNFCKGILQVKINLNLNFWANNLHFPHKMEALAAYKKVAFQFLQRNFVE